MTASAKVSFYRPELDLLRFAAFMLVFLHHGTVIAGFGQIVPNSTSLFDLVRSAAGYGLCLFFVLSSYLITEILLRERESTGTIHIKAFYVRRVLRIWPLYFAFLAVGLEVGHLQTSLHVSIRYVMQYVFLLGNYAFYAHNTANPIGPLWSISVEEQFYLCWPFLAMWVGRRGLLLLSVLLIPVGVAWSSWLTVFAARPGFAIWTNSVTEFECFAAGALLAILLHGKTWRVSPGVRAALAVLGCAAWAVSDGVFRFKRDELFVDRQQLPHVLGFQLIVVGCCLFFLSILSLPLGPWSRPLLYLGRISYGLYVFHILALDLVSALAGAMGKASSTPGTAAVWVILAASFALTAGMASLSYHFFESRFLRLKSRFTYVRTAALH